jgi:tetratricopeptide (TPR) repeat protein
MAITKKKPRKKRQPVPELPLSDEEKAKIQYKDEFQTNLGGRIEKIGSRLQGKGRTIMYGFAALAVLLIIVSLFYVWNRRTNNAAQAALGKAIETSQAQVTDSPLPAGVTVKTYKTEKERAEAAIKEFQAVADQFGGSYAEKAKYFIAINKLDVDKAAGMKELEGLSGTSGEVGVMSKFALAQAYAADGKYPEAEKLYAELSKVENPVISMESIRFELAKVYEKQNKTREAADLYFQIAKEASEAKDSENKPLPLSQTAVEAKEKIKELDPERAKQIKEPELPAGLPFG